ncbi:MAG: hypothetical protein K9N46_00595 [Candidatus Marinimicrobia bacterium]|nr:hypothetical protein [Candidatus Neomarinimicrobiota bacterium]MCF7828026.1 hypothetical protein [Candidatus Neomarinimicrobiota bacterium]MCF7879219.1 hypothetical protein [Candidatus Neomarinimicrobiota bacterium]
MEKEKTESFRRNPVFRAIVPEGTPLEEESREGTSEVNLPRSFPAGIPLGRLRSAVAELRSG